MLEAHDRKRWDRCRGLQDCYRGVHDGYRGIYGCHGILLQYRNATEELVMVIGGHSIAIYGKIRELQYHNRVGTLGLVSGVMRLL